MKRKDFIQNLSLAAIGFTALPLKSFADEHTYAKEIFQVKDLVTNEQFDAIIIGGSYAGLSTAMSLARCLRKVLVIDAGEPRNAMVSNANNLFGNDGLPPKEITNRVRQQLERYQPFITIINTIAIGASGTDLNFTVQASNNNIYKGKKIIFATGCKDELPLINGFTEYWGKQIHHCPYCHGFESTSGKTLLISNGLEGTSLMGSLAHWCKDLVFCTNGEPVNDDRVKDFFTKENIVLETNKIIGIKKVNKSNLMEVEMSNGTKQQFKHIYYHSNPIYNTKLAQDLGCKTDNTKRLIVKDFMQCSVAGLYAVGDVANKSIEQIIWAAHSGVMAAVNINNELIALKYKNS